VGRTLSHVGSAVTSLTKVGLVGAAAGLAAATYGAVRFGKELIQTASSAEQMRLRLTTMLGSTAEANAMFDDLLGLAKRLPFAYESMAASATTLSGVLKGGRDDVTAWLPLIGDLAATTGLGIEETTGQVVRMLSAGAGAADLFRERGVLAMMGFTAGVNYSAEESARVLVEQWASAESQFRGTSERLVDTFAGQVDQLKDAWFLFVLEVAEGGAYDAFKRVVTALTEIAEHPALADLAQQVAVWAASAVESIAKVVENWRRYAALTADTGAGVLRTVAVIIDELQLLARVAIEAQYRVASVGVFGVAQDNLDAGYERQMEWIERLQGAAAGARGAAGQTEPFACAADN